MFREIATAELTTQTTCFSGAKTARRNVSCQKSPRPRSRILTLLATENHCVCVSFEEPTGERFVSASRLPRILIRAREQDAKNFTVRGERTCLAHSFFMLESDNGFKCESSAQSSDRPVRNESDGLGVPPDAPGNELENSCYWEAFALRSKKKAHDVLGSNLSQQNQSETHIGGISEAHGNHDHDRSSIKKAGFHRRQGSMDAKRSQEDNSSPYSDVDVTKNAEAYLVVRNPEVDYTSDEQDALATPLTYKPMALHVTSIAIVDSEERSHVGVFVASADDVKLRLYMQSGCIAKQQRFLEVTSDETHLGGSSGERSSFISTLSLSSPAMALDTLKVSDDQKKASYNILAIGCQDGSIRIITFQCNTHDDPHREKDVSYSFNVIDSSTFLVDGPIASVQLSMAEKGVVLCCGSLCGFACLFKQKGHVGSTFQGPYAIVEDLWDGRLDSEDSVFSVHYFQFGGALAGSSVAVGTCSGRLLLFEPDVNRSKSGLKTARHVLFWSCQLPYPIHGICSTGVDDDGVVELIVTTRKTVHIFRADAAARMAATIKERLEKMKGGG